MSARVYLDHNATSSLRPVARQAMERIFDRQANASSVHREGQSMRGEVEAARSTVAKALGCADEALLFTAGGTEACLTAITGIAKETGISRVLVSAIEHTAVLDAATVCGLEVETIGVDSNGRILLDRLEASLSVAEGGKALVCLMAANNETGVAQPVEEAMSIAGAFGALVFCDAVQAFSKMPFNVGDLGVDMAAVSAHKIGGPQGAGGLYIKPGLTCAPLIPGRQERGGRGGTENVPAIAGFGAAAEAAMEALPSEIERLGQLRDRLESGTGRTAPQTVFVGKTSPRLSNTAALAMPGVAAESLVIALDLEGFAVSAGAACSSGKVGNSHVLQAMGLPSEMADSTVRISLGWNTTQSDVDAFIAAWGRCAERHSSMAA